VCACGRAASSAVLEQRRTRHGTSLAPSDRAGGERSFSSWRSVPSPFSSRTAQILTSDPSLISLGAQELGGGLPHPLGRHVPHPLLVRLLSLLPSRPTELISLLKSFRALLTVISTLPGYHSFPVLARILFGLDTTIVVLFTLEVRIRLAVPVYSSLEADLSSLRSKVHCTGSSQLATDRVELAADVSRSLFQLIGHSDSRSMLWNHATSFLSIIDFLSVFPYYLEVMLHDDTVRRPYFVPRGVLRLLVVCGL
jgi:hypothetical protein